MSIDEVTFKPIWHNNGYTQQVVEGSYHGFIFTETTYFPPALSSRPVNVFYEFWPEDGKIQEYPGSTVIESAYEAGFYGIGFREIEPLIAFLDQYKGKGTIKDETSNY